MGRRQTKKKNCLICNKEIYPRVDGVKRGMGKYCSPACAGIAKRKGDQHPIEYLVELYQKIGTKKIAQKLGMNQKTVIKRLRNHGVEFRKAQIRTKGYRVVNAPGHPNCRVNGQISEHTLIASEKIGRPLKKKEVVHHINLKSLDNNPENLSVLTRKKHGEHHFQMSLIAVELLKAGLVEYTPQEGYQITQNLREYMS